MTFKEILLGLLAGALGSALFVYVVENRQLESRLEAIERAADQERIKNAKQLSTAADSLVAASREYDSVKSERDRLALRLRQSVSNSGGAANSAGACEVRATRLEGVVRDLHELVERCDSGWHGCASRKDALVQAVR